MNGILAATITTPSILSGAGFTAFLVGVITGIVVCLFIRR